MTDQAAFLADGARFLAEADPLRAARILASGLDLQSRGGRVSAFRMLAVALVEADRGILADLREALSKLDTPA